MKTYYARFIVSAIVLLLSACAISPYHYTKIVNVSPNTEQKAKPPYHAPVVAVLVDSPTRATIENALVAALRARGIDARAALPIYGNQGIADKSRRYIAGQLEKNGFDTAIAVRLLKKTSENLNVMPAPSGPAPTVSGMMLKAEPLGPNFMLNETTYVARINLWDVHQQAIVWSATSITHNPQGMGAGARQFAKVIAKRLASTGLFATKAR